MWTLWFSVDITFTILLSLSCGHYTYYFNITLMWILCLLFYCWFNVDITYFIYYWFNVDITLLFYYCFKIPVVTLFLSPDIFQPFFGNGESANRITGCIRMGSEVLCTFEGHWDQQIYIKELTNRVRRRWACGQESQCLLYKEINSWDHYIYRTAMASMNMVSLF